MRLAALCLAVLGQGSPEPASCPEPGSLGHRVRVVEMQGLEWRGRLHAQLRPIARQGGATVWLMPESEASALEGEAKHVLFTPRPSTGREVRAQGRTSLRVPYLAHLERVADGPYGLATAVAYKPETAYAEETLSVSVRCRPEGTGARASVAIDETRLAALETHEIREAVLPGPKAKPDAKPTELKAQVQVPTVVGGEVEGEWSVPDGQVLVVGLGAHEMKKPDGTRVITERVAIIDPDTPPPAPALARARTRIIGPPTDRSAARVALVQAPRPLPRPTPPPDLVAPAPQPIAEAGRWTRRPSDVVALRPNQPPMPAIAPLPSAGMPVAVPAQPIVIQSPGSGATIIILPGSGPVSVMTPAPEALAMLPPPVVAAPALPVAMMPGPPSAALNVPTMPVLPERSLPTPRNAAGEALPLPPLPEAEAHVPFDESGDPVATPQSLPAPSDSATEELPSSEGDETLPPTVEPVADAASIPGHFSLALASGATWADEVCSPADDCPAQAFVLGVKPAGGWRAATQDRAVERTAMAAPHGKLSVGIHATAPVPTVSSDGDTTRVAVPVGPFRIQVEMKTERRGDDCPEHVDGQP